MPWSVVLSGYSASSTTKTGRHDTAEILLKVALNIITLTANHIIILLLLLNNYIMSSFHLESPVWLVKKLTRDIVNETSSVIEAHNHSTPPISANYFRTS